MNRTRRRTTIVAALLGLLGAVALVASGGEESSPQLDALRADPLARYAPAGARPAKQSQSAGGRALGKPSPARFSRWFALRPAEAQARFADAVRAANAAGWRVQVAPDGDAAVGSKHLRDRAASAVVALYDDPELLPPEVPPPALAIILSG